jgi:prepilin-type N-terminal cleavage/methylation domain-containing protein
MKGEDIVRSCNRTPCRAGDESGVSLIELLVSMAIMAIIMTALAGTLIVTLTTVNKAEEEVTATQLAGELSEAVGTGEFDLVALYEDDINPTLNPLAIDWDVRLDAADTFEGAEVVTVAGPSGTRDSRYPEPVVLETRQGIDFRIDRYVTWIDRDGDGNVETKRLTSFVSWVDRTGSDHELRFDSERAPTPDEAVATAGGTGVIQFTFNPDPVELDATTGELLDTVDIFVRTNEGTSFASFKLYEYDEASGTFTLTTIPATGQTFGSVSNYVTWVATLPLSTVLANGTVDVRFEAQDAAGSDVAAIATLDVYGGPWNASTPTPDGTGAAPTPTPSQSATPTPTPTPTTTPADVSITIDASPTSLCVASGGQQALKSSVTITITVDGLGQEDGRAFVSYPYYSHKKALEGDEDRVANDAMNFVSADAGGVTYTLTIPARDKVFKDGATVLFTINAERQTGTASEDDDQATFTATVTSAC